MSEARLLSLTSSLGRDALVPVRLDAVERLGEPYRVEVEALALDPALRPADLLTQEVTATVTQPLVGAPVVRHFHGHVAELERLGPAAGGRTAFRLVLVPGLWRLGLRSRCRIFQAKSVKEIVAAVLAEHGLPAPVWGMLPALQAIPYCTQFNETDLHFVSRLLQEHGLTYYFEHGKGSHKLHVSGSAPGFPAFAGGDVTAVHGSSQNLQDLDGWRRVNRARPAAVELEDQDAERNRPSVVLSRATKTRAFDGEPPMWDSARITHWPGGMSTRPGVDPSAIEMGFRETQSEQYDAHTVDPRFWPGVRVGVKLRDELGAQPRHNHIVTEVRHQAQDQSGLVSGAGGTESYQGRLQLVHADRPWMPAPRHTRPVMPGLYSAMVTGPAGEKIHVDGSGRIKVRFRWDKTGSATDASSCWVPVAQAAAGAWGGTWFLPRVGDEVLVAFLDGDPDRPVVTGSLYNQDAQPPFDPKNHRTRSGISTRSDPGGGAADANVLRFDDKAGDEDVLLHAQKNLTVEVEHSRKVTVEASDDLLEVQKGHRKTQVKSGNDSLTIDRGDLSIKCGAGSVLIEAMQKITLKVGQSTVVIDQSGITAKGVTITAEAQAMHQTKAPMIQAEASAMVKVQGGIVMLN